MKKQFSINTLLILLALFVMLSITIYAILKLAKIIDNDVYKSIAYAVLFTIIIAVVVIRLKLDKTSLTDSKNLLRYSLLCKKCGWEWMSHSTSKAFMPSQCPKCGNTKKNTIEIIGWRKFDATSKKDKDLRHFFQQ